MPRVFPQVYWSSCRMQEYRRWVILECEDCSSLWPHARRPPSLYLISFPCLKTKHTCLKMWASWCIKVCGFLWTAVVVGYERYSVVLRFKSVIVWRVWNLRSCGCDHYWRVVCDIVCFGRCQHYGGTWCLGFRVKMVEDVLRRLLWKVSVYLRNYTVARSNRQLCCRIWSSHTRCNDSSLEVLDAVDGGSRLLRNTNTYLRSTQHQIWQAVVFGSRVILQNMTTVTWLVKQHSSGRP